MPISFADRTEQLRREQQLLVRAVEDIDEGWNRNRDQQYRLDQLHEGGHDTRQAETLVELLKQTLFEWERHRILIEQRVAFLQKEVDLAKRRAG